MTVISLLPEGGKESSIVLFDFVIARGHLYYFHTEDSCNVIIKKLHQLCEIKSPIALDWNFVIYVCL